MTVTNRISSEHIKTSVPPSFDEEIIPHEPPVREHKTLKELLEYDPFSLPVSIHDVKSFASAIYCSVLMH
jgi:hypothetical protein